VTESAAKPYPEPYEWRNERDQLADAGALTLLLTERHHQQRRRDVQRGRECPYVVDVDAAPTGLDVLDERRGSASRRRSRGTAARNRLTLPIV
jgi:hypothetical protein